jgi:hypothetical protein
LTLFPFQRCFTSQFVLDPKAWLLPEKSFFFVLTPTFGAPTLVGWARSVAY